MKEKSWFKFHKRMMDKNKDNPIICSLKRPNLAVTGITLREEPTEWKFPLIINSFTFLSGKSECFITFLAVNKHHTKSILSLFNYGKKIDNFDTEIRVKIIPEQLNKISKNKFSVKLDVNGWQTIEFDLKDYNE